MKEMEDHILEFQKSATSQLIERAACLCWRKVEKTPDTVTLQGSESGTAAGA